MSIIVKDAGGANTTVNTLPALGAASSANSLPVTHASDDVLVGLTANVSAQVLINTTATANIATQVAAGTVQTANVGALVAAGTVQTANVAAQTALVIAAAANTAAQVAASVATTANVATQVVLGTAASVNTAVQTAAVGVQVANVAAQTVLVANAVAGIGAANSAVYTDATGVATGGLIAVAKGMFVSLSTLLTRLPSSLGTKDAAASLSITPSADQDPIYDHVNGVKVSANTSSVALITPPAGCKFVRIHADGDIFLNTANVAASDTGTSIRLLANSPEIVSVTPLLAVTMMAANTSATVRATPLKSR